ncbi:sulfur carrier protein ThiS [bacterium LRH843]|nr:sulfur carrier protein ThiS [bacterium LRH843]
MKMFINGEEYSLDVKTLAEVVAHFELESHLVVTEVDGVIIDQTDWEHTAIKEEMKIELVQFVGGG